MNIAELTSESYLRIPTSFYNIDIDDGYSRKLLYGPIMHPRGTYPELFTREQFPSIAIRSKENWNSTSNEKVSDSKAWINARNVPGQLSAQSLSSFEPSNRGGGTEGRQRASTERTVQADEGSESRVVEPEPEEPAVFSSTEPSAWTHTTQDPTPADAPIYTSPQPMGHSSYVRQRAESHLDPSRAKDASSQGRSNSSTSTEHVSPQPSTHASSRDASDFLAFWQEPSDQHRRFPPATISGGPPLLPPLLSQPLQINLADSSTLSNQRHISSFIESLSSTTPHVNYFWMPAGNLHGAGASATALAYQWVQWNSGIGFGLGQGQAGDGANANYGAGADWYFQPFLPATALAPAPAPAPTPALLPPPLPRASRYRPQLPLPPYTPYPPTMAITATGTGTGKGMYLRMAMPGLRRPRGRRSGQRERNREIAREKRQQREQEQQLQQEEHENQQQEEGSSK